MKDFKAVIFDFDGVIIDSEPIWDGTDAVFLAKRGAKYTKELKMRILGQGLGESIEIFKKEFGISGDTDELVKERRQIFYELALKDLKLIDDAKEFIEKISSFKLAIATGGHKKEKVIEILSKFSLQNYFTVIVSSDEVENGKPHPDVFLHTAKILGVDPFDCLVLEESPNGVVAGKRAGMTVFGINKDDKIREDLKKAGADRVFESLTQISLEI